MSEHPKRENYDSDSDFFDAMADHYGIDRRMLRHIPIPKMTHDDDTCPHLVRANLLEAENARLKAEVEELKALTSEMDSTINVSQAACREYKAEVERLEEIVGSDAIDRKYGMCCDASDEVARLKAEVERLTEFTTRTIIPNEELQAQVERLTKAVMHSPAAQLKLKELEGKNTYEEINPKEGKQSNG